MAAAFRASIYHCVADPGEESAAAATQYIEDGVLLVDAGHVARLGPAEVVLPELGPGIEITDYRGRLIVPGLIDCHVHYPQLDIIAARGEHLLDWLTRHAYPAEIRFADPVYAHEVAGRFVEQLLRNGTTTALVFATVHSHSAEAIFEAALAWNMRLISGKVLMDRNCPRELSDSPASAYADSLALIRKWHGKGRLGYAITPRFALTSSPEQLEACARLAAEYPDTWVHTHLSEHAAEVEAVARQFPARRSYFDVYDGFGLARRRSMFAHCLHLDDMDRRAMADRRAAAAFCPTSNLFLGSGLFNLGSMVDAGVRVGIATDVGAGTSLSLLRTLSEAYKVLHLQGQAFPASRALYFATLGAARALDLEDRIGNFEVGKEADFVVIDPAATGALARRAGAVANVDELLFALMFLGDERNIAATYLQGTCATN